MSDLSPAKWRKAISTLMTAFVGKEASMRKFAVIIIALATLGFLADVASAGKIKIQGTHPADEIERTCSNVGGTFFPPDASGGYSCTHQCGGTTCLVDCNKDNQCTGDCPKCGRRERNLPVLGGAGAVERTLKNSVERPSKPY